MPSTAASRANATPSSTLTGSGASAGTPSSAPTRAASSSRRRTLRSMTDSSIGAVAHGGDECITPRTVRSGHHQIL